MEAPRLPSIFRNVKREPRRFRYRPKHYDPRAEAIEERKKLIEDELARERGEEAAGLRKPSFRSSWQRQSYSSAASMANLRLIVILIVLLVLAFAAAGWLEKFS